MKKLISSCIALAMFSAVAVFAQDSGAPPARFSPEQMIAKHVSRLSTLLNLTATQQTQATALFTDEQNAAKTARANMRAAHTALKTAIENNDANGITAQATQIGSLTTAEIESHAKAEATFFAMLSADQQTKYKQLQAAGGPMGGRGFGGGPGRM
jgi:Spy/CpxP family protein refolding chaperone